MVVIPLVDFFKSAGESIMGFFTVLWEGIKSVWRDVTSWFASNIIEPLRRAFDAVIGSITFVIIHSPIDESTSHIDSQFSFTKITTVATTATTAATIAAIAAGAPNVWKTGRRCTFQTNKR